MAEKQLIHSWGSGIKNVKFGSVDAKSHEDIVQYLQVNEAPFLVFKHKDGVLNLPNNSLAHDIVREISSIVKPTTSTKMSCSDLKKNMARRKPRRAWTSI